MLSNWNAIDGTVIGNFELLHFQVKYPPLPSPPPPPPPKKKEENVFAFRSKLHQISRIFDCEQWTLEAVLTIATQSKTRCNFLLVHRECLGVATYSFWPHPHGIVKVHLCVGTQELQERYRLSSAPKIGKRCPLGTEKVSCPEGKRKQRKQKNKIWEDRAFGKLRLTECDLIFSTHASERTSDNCVLGFELDKITGCLAYLQQ